MKKLIPLVVITALFTLGSFAHPPHDGKRGDHLATMLELNADQRASVEAIMESHRGRKSALRELDREQRRDAMQLLKQDIRSDMANVLTAEQLAKFDEIQAKQGERTRNRAKHREQHDRKRGAHLATMLELNADQRASVEAIMESHRGRKSALRELDREQRRDAMQLLKQDIRSDMANVLTAEQLAKFDEIQAKQGERTRNRAKHREQHDRKRGAHLATMLELNADQRASVEAIMESHRGRKSALRELDREQRRDAMQLLKQDIRSDMANVLTAEQLAKFDEIQAKRGDRARNRQKHREQHEQRERDTSSDTL